MRRGGSPAPAGALQKKIVFLKIPPTFFKTASLYIQNPERSRQVDKTYADRIAAEYMEKILDQCCQGHFGSMGNLKNERTCLIG